MLYRVRLDRGIHEPGFWTLVECFPKGLIRKQKLTNFYQIFLWLPVSHLIVSFSSCQRNLIKTFQIEAMIALITKMVLIFSWDLLNGQKKTSKSAEIWFSKSIFNVKNHENLSKIFFVLKNLAFFDSYFGHLTSLMKKSMPFL